MIPRPLNPPSLEAPPGPSKTYLFAGIRITKVLKKVGSLGLRQALRPGILQISAEALVLEINGTERLFAYRPFWSQEA